MSKIEFLAPYWEIEEENSLEDPEAYTRPQPDVSAQPTDKVIYLPDLWKTSRLTFSGLTLAQAENVWRKSVSGKDIDNSS